MIRPGEVTAVRELKRGVQAQVCLGSSTEHGTAVVTVTSASPAVKAALKTLHLALRDEAGALMAKQLEGQKAWES